MTAPMTETVSETMPDPALPVAVIRDGSGVDRDKGAKCSGGVRGREGAEAEQTSYQSPTGVQDGRWSRADSRGSDGDVYISLRAS